jgi:1,2-diacylglycerol 3-alpha-glucosyltransferase
MQVLLISDSALPRHDGIATSLRSLTAILDSLGFAVTLIGTATTRQSYPCAQVLSVPAMTSYCDYPLAWPAPMMVRRAVKVSDVVHVHTLGPLGVMGLVAAKASRRPTVLSIHTNFDAYAEHYRVVRFGLHILAMLTTGRQGGQPLSSIASAVAALAEVIVLPRFEQAEGLATVQRHPRLYVIPNEVCLTAPIVPKGGSEADILYVGRMAAEKSVDVLLRCFANCVLKRDNSHHLTLVGDGPKLSHLKSYAINLGLGERHIKWLGDVDNYDVLRLMSVSRVLAFPSLSEVDPMVLTEAAVIGLPAVVRDSRLIGYRPQAMEVFAADCESFGRALLATTRTRESHMTQDGTKFRTAEQWLHVYQSLRRFNIARI